MHRYRLQSHMFLCIHTKAAATSLLSWSRSRRSLSIGFKSWKQRSEDGQTRKKNGLSSVNTLMGHSRFLSSFFLICSIGDWLVTFCITFTMVLHRLTNNFRSNNKSSCYPLDLAARILNSCVRPCAVSGFELIFDASLGSQFFQKKKFQSVIRYQ